MGIIREEWDQELPIGRTQKPPGAVITLLIQ
uniref:Uncharacterized protein n=1 Tax=Podoviridae sp. ct8Lf7 TaxID=2827723 RepID=A0A8S5S0C6_9CAUD|nr:MAG TPA: hypothetical protein [Podoviridae sp. ct8Lf7]